MTGKKLCANGKVILILDMLLERATQEGLPETERDELYDYLGGFLDDNTEGVNTTLLQGIEIVLNR
jgi:hypothetical protein